MSELGFGGGWRHWKVCVHLLVGLLWGAMQGWAQELIVHEPFDYPSGGLGNKRGGVGFLGAWQGGVPDAPVTANYATEAGSMGVSGLETSGGMVRASV